MNSVILFGDFVQALFHRNIQPNIPLTKIYLGSDLNRYAPPKMKHPKRGVFVFGEMSGWDSDPRAHVANEPNVSTVCCPAKPEMRRVC